MRISWRQNWASLLLLLVSLVLISAEETVMPSFRELPPPLIYYQDSSVVLKCVARPSTALVKIVYRTQKDTNFNKLTEETQGSVVYSLRNPDSISETDIHCVAKTGSLGNFLSRPVRLKRAKIQRNNGGQISVPEKFYKGNIAQVLCSIPESQPPARIDFEKDDYPVGDDAQHQTDKYMKVKLPHTNTMALLIRDFSKTDAGVYSCKATNPVTMESVRVKRRVNLMYGSITKMIGVTFRMDDPFRTKASSSHKVELLEGENATVYCLPEGAPIPSVNWYRHDMDKSLPTNFKVDSKFGTLKMTNVQSADESEFMCSAKQGQGTVLTTPINLKVRKRLKIIKAPQTITAALGSSAQLVCQVSGGKPGDSVSPEWYHNGTFIDPHRSKMYLVKKSTEKSRDDSSSEQIKWHSTLTIHRAVSDTYGVYQCVARSENEWDSAAAALLKPTQTLISGEEKDKREAEKEKQRREERLMKQRRKKEKKKRKNRNRNKNERGVKPKLEAPSVKLLYDNLALHLQWKYHGEKTPKDFYRIQYQEREFKRAESWETTQTRTISKNIYKEYYTVTEGLSPGKGYRFRVTLVESKSGESVYSDWSSEVDFSHMMDVKPMILEVLPQGEDALRISWKYQPSRRNEIYPVTVFMILVRRFVGKRKFAGYMTYKAKSSARELLIKQLRPGSVYQVVMFGAVEDREKRYITRFSNAVSKSTGGKPPTEVAVGPPGKRHNSAESTKLMFWILGGLAGVMLVVMAFLVGLCLLRQRREKKRNRAATHAQLNGTALDSYKDPAKMQFRRQHAQAQSQANNQFILSQLGGNTMPGVPNHNGTWSGSHPPHHSSNSYLRGSSASVQQLHQQVPGSGMNLNVVPETQSLMMDHYQQQHNQPDMTTDLGGYGPPSIHGYHNQHGHHNGTLGSKSQLSGITSHHQHPHEHDLGGEMGYHMNTTGSVGPYRPLGGYAPPFMGSQRPSHLDVRPTPCGDAESIYSYFSQQEMGVQHCGLSDVPGGPPMNYRPHVAEAGSQTTDRQQHRHHRRRRRKQASVPPTGPGGPLPTAMEHSVAPSPPMMRDMAVNTELGTTEGTYDQPATSNHLPYGYQMPAQSMTHYMPQDSSGGATASSAASSTPAYHSVTPPARMASLGPHHGYHYHQQPQQMHHQQGHHHQPQQVDLGPSGPSDASTLTRRGTPTLFIDPPKMRDYSEYAIPETKA